MSMNLRLATIAALPVVGILLWAGFAKETSMDRIIAGAIDRGEINLSYGTTVAKLAEPFLANSRFAGRLNVTEAPRPDKMNLYVLSKVPAGLNALTCNCGYIGNGIIVCDKKFIETFSKSINYDLHGPNVGELLAKVDADFAKWLASWLIGHEIGHLILHDGDGAFTRQLRERRRSATEAQEAQADAFFVQHINPEDRKRATFTLTNFVFQIVHRSYRPAFVPGAPGKAVVKPSVDGIHPPWIERALHLARIISEMDQPGEQTDSYYDGLAGLIEVSPSGLDIGSLCAAERLRD
jgi:hypothetical protein